MLHSQLLWTTTGATGILFLSVLDVVSYRLIGELNSTADGFRIDLSGLDLRENRLCTFQEGFFNVFSSLGARLEEN